MMNTFEDVSVTDEIIAETGRVFSPGNREMLENTSPSLVREMAKRRLEEILKYKAFRAGTEIL